MEPALHRGPGRPGEQKPSFLGKCALKEPGPDLSGTVLISSQEETNLLWPKGHVWQKAWVRVRCYGEGDWAWVMGRHKPRNSLIPYWVWEKAIYKENLERGCSQEQQFLTLKCTVGE
jgi:hypothetical protein